MTHYYFSIEDPSKNRFRIGKFDPDQTYPLDTYTITYNEHHQVCDCPAYKPRCKHIEWFEIWRDEYGLKPGLYYDDKTHVWMDTELADTSEMSEMLDDLDNQSEES